MHPLTLETDHRSSTPQAARSGGANDDLFAMLLRQHSDTRDTDAARPRKGDAREDDRAAPAPRPGATERRERAAEAPGERVGVDDAPARTDAPRRDDAGRRTAANDVGAAPDAAAGAGQAMDTAQSPVDPAATPAAAATTVPTAPAAKAPPPATTPEISATAASTMPAAPAATPSDAANALPVTPAAPPAGAAAPTAAAPTDIAAPVPAAPAAPQAAAAPQADQPPAAVPSTYELPAGKPAPSLPAAALSGDATAEPTTPSTDAVAEGEAQISRAPTPAAGSSAAAQGLGRLGTGAEVALAAQAAGEAGRPSDTGSAKKPSAGTTQQVAVNVQGDGKPASSAPVAPASVPTGGAVQPQPAAGVQIAASFEAALNGAASDTEFAPGGTTAPGALQGAGLHATATASATPKAAAAAAAAPAEQLAVHIQRAARDGNTRITVQLNPVELGQVEVHLDFASDGRVSATILADRADTLDMLQRDARLLERSLQDAGLQTGNGSLSFDLRDGGRQGFGQQALSRGHEGHDTTADGRKAAAVEQAPPASKGITDSGVDIHV